MGGGCDANVLNRRGFEVANLGTGMRDIHTVKEWLRVSDMVRTAEVIVEMVRLHARRLTVARAIRRATGPRSARRAGAGARRSRGTRRPPIKLLATITRNHSTP